MMIMPAELFAQNSGNTNFIRMLSAHLKNLAFLGLSSLPQVAGKLCLWLGYG
jgi:hypothetical protein